MSKKEISEIMSALKELSADFKAHKEEVEPLLELLKGAVVARQLILFTTSTLVGLIAAYIAITQLFQ